MKRQQSILIRGSSISKNRTMSEQSIEEFVYRLRKDEKYMDYQWVLYPDDPIKYYWDSMTVILFIYNVTVFPVLLCFEDKDSTNYQITTIIMNILYTIDIIVQFFSAYYNDQNVLIYKNKDIVSNYLKGWFLFDFFCTFPFENLNISPNNKHSAINGMIRMLRIFKVNELIKITKLIKIIRTFTSGILANFFANISIGMSLFGIMLAIIIFCHVVGCIWFYLCSLQQTTPNWVFNNINYTVSNQQQSSELLTTNFQKYVLSFYFVCQTFITTGYGDYAPVSINERLACTILMLIGVFIYSLLMSHLINTLVFKSEGELKYAIQVQKIEKLAKKYKIPEWLCWKVDDHFRLYQYKDLDSKYLLDQLNPAQRKELVYQMNREVINGIPFLESQPVGFISDVCECIQIQSKEANYPIYRQYEDAQEVIFIKKGTVAFFLDDDHGGFEFMKLEQGDFFGDIELFFNNKVRKYNVKTYTDCELYILPKENLDNIFEKFFVIKTNFLQNVYLKKKILKKIFRRALQYCQENVNDVKNLGKVDTEVFTSKNKDLIEKFRNQNFDKISGFVNQNSNSNRVTGKDSYLKFENKKNKTKLFYQLIQDIYFEDKKVSYLIYINLDQNL